MEDEEFVGCMSCMKTTNLCDLFAECMDNSETYAKKLETCFDLKIPAHLKYICSECAEKLDVSVAFKEQTVKGLSSLQTVKDEEYLDETILEEAESVTPDNHEKTSIISNCGSEADDEYNDDEDHAIQALDETTCIYCDLQLNSIEDVNEHIRVVHKLEPRTGLPLRECTICGVALQDVADHHNRCHGVKSDADGRKYPCHFCDNVYASKKACFTHLRMKHGLKLCNEQTPKYVTRERKKCHLCDRDFSQKQILNKHLWKAHGFEVEKRKAFICPLCDERVSYGSYFSAHLLHAHRVHEQVEQLEFHNMDDFMLFKSAIQEETKYRFRKTTASKQTIEGVRSHYMCSQSGVYVYQGKGKRPAPERQIYKTGKACPAHMIVTETMDSVLVTFYKTHVGHGQKENFVRKLGDPYWASVVDYGLIPLPIRGDRCPCSGDEYALPLLHACPYFEPRKPKKIRCETEAGGSIDFEEILKSEPNLEGECGEESSWMCDACGIPLADADKFRAHVATHGLELFPCQYCELDFQNLDDWTRHVRLQHNMASLF